VTLLAFVAGRRAAADVDRRRPRLMQTHRAAEITAANPLNTRLQHKMGQTDERTDGRRIVT